MRLFLRIQWLASRLSRLIGIGHTGLWLGVFTRNQLHTIGELFYTRQGFYWTEEWNKRGLFDWEKRALETFFAGCRSLLVAGAGGGREVIALRRAGIEAQGFESHPSLCDSPMPCWPRREWSPTYVWLPGTTART